MNILIAPDSYKGSLTASEVAEHISQGIRDVVPGAAIDILPLADGGEGTVDAILKAAGGVKVELEVTGPSGDPVKSFFGILEDRKTAVIEVAAASGIVLVPKERLDPLKATSYGTGQLMKAALDHGCSRLIIGLGGSATNDGGAGMAMALGIRFPDADGRDIPFGGGDLDRIRSIDVSGLDARLAGCEIIIASDVTNPLCGPRGASAVFGPQKGATPPMVEKLDGNLCHYGKMIEEKSGIGIIDREGAGAAGGLGVCMIAFMSAQVRRGIDMIFEVTGFEERVRQADLVFTGEGRTDSQTAFGKAPAGVAKLAKKYGKPVVCISGGITEDVSSLYEHGLDVIVGATQSPMTLEEAIVKSPQSIRHAAASVMRAMQIGRMGG
jgi:glycerate kinase